MAGLTYTGDCIALQVRNIETAERFLSTVARFKERVAWHGESAEGSGPLCAGKERKAQLNLLSSTQGTLLAATS